MPTYRVGSNLIRADLNLMQSVLASSIWQYWQRGFCASFPLPLSVQRVLPSDAPFLQAGDGSIADFDRNRQLSNLRMLDGRKVGASRICCSPLSSHQRKWHIYQYLVLHTVLILTSVLLCLFSFPYRISGISSKSLQLECFYAPSGQKNNNSTCY